MVNECFAKNEEMVDGVYPLGAPIRLSAHNAVYETEISEGDGVVPAVIRIREVEPAEAEDLKERMRDAGELAHPNLLKIYAVGSSTVNEASVSYVVMERADESLEGVLAERALTESETREMLGPTLEALEYLHKKGYAHLRLRPSNVLAVNDRLKLSADSLVRANDREAAEDMRALGALIVQALGQEMPDFDKFRDLAEIVEHCLDPDPDSRWTAEDVKARLNVHGPIVPENIVVEEMPRSTGVPKWIFAGLAALILIVIVAAVLRNNHPAPVAATQAPARVVPAPPVEVLPSANPPDERKASGWSVIVGAYGSREAAEKRMREMTKRWPKFEISLFESHAEKVTFLVVLGRNLSEDQAEALRKRAVGSGLPHDTYIKRVKQ
jgi:hypothetical protein